MTVRKRPECDCCGTRYAGLFSVGNNLWRCFDCASERAARLAVEVADLKRRVRLARRLASVARFSENHHDMLLATLDLRRPLSRGRR